MTRIDIASDCAFATLVDPRSAAVQYKLTTMGHDFYHAVRYGFDQAQLDSVSVNLTSSLSRNPTVEQARSYLDSVGVSYDDSDEFIEDVLMRLNSSYDPYRAI
ncbi:MAG: hypothetical protein ACLP9Y_10080 [Mycobacterium sp.]